MKTKKCINCYKIKDISEFYTTGGRINYSKNKCKDCENLYHRNKYKNSEKVRLIKKKDAILWKKNNKERYNNYRKDWARISPKGIYSRIKNTSKRRGFKDIISKPDFINWYESENKICRYCKISIQSDNKLFLRQSKSLTIDRLNPKKPYIKGNLGLACYLCNTMKSNILTDKQMKEIGLKYITPLWQKKIN